MVTRTTLWYALQLDCSRETVCDPQGGDFDDLYPDVCVEGLEKDPF